MGQNLGSTEHSLTGLTSHDWQVRYSQQAVWTKPLRDYLFQPPGARGNTRILDVGCGPATLTAELRTRFGSGVYGLDIDIGMLRLAKTADPVASFLEGDANSLPFQRGCFDLTCCHFLLLWVRHPVECLKEMRRVTRSGGTVLALAEPDYGGRIDYPPALEEIGQLQAASLASQGADPLAGRKLAGWFSQAGLEQVQVGVLGGQWWMEKNASGESEWAMIEHDLEGLISPEKLRELQGEDRTSRASGERILFVPTFYASGTVPA